MLRRDVVEAVEAGRFHIYSVTSVDQVVELMTGLPAGSRDAAGAFPEGSINHMVEGRLKRFAETLREFNAPAPNFAPSGQESEPAALVLPD
jgi:predicted ATP-dependent protease